MITFECIKYSYKTSRPKTSCLCIKSNTIFYKSKGIYKPIEEKLAGILLGCLTVTFRNLHPLKFKPWKCISIVTTDRTYDFEFLKNSDLSVFLFATRLFKNVVGDKLHTISQSKIKMLRENCEDYWIPEDPEWLKCYISYKDWHKNFIENDPDYIFSTFSNKQRKLCPENSIGETCTICLEQFTDLGSYIELPCKHMFHKDCLKSWILKKKQCPLCRKKLI